MEASDVAIELKCGVNQRQIFVPLYCIILADNDTDSSAKCDQIKRAESECFPFAEAFLNE